ncbi:hypothetical protein JZM24_16280 [Candidatus Sodalis endolongispinus]|uniref:Uncharacterized protein n=1 Tax=Candidatus Sodalis endolongispinus TaxID=2812662 RepID=A0ABS5YEB1_9GAMM|nr:hypothetical protein [Candidatus Sodalis endolongispinus]MBT9433279.1 hypothetical protein [Candidatus Sodalis endolongispinus]
MALQWAFPHGGVASSAPSAGSRAADVDDTPPPLPPKRRSRAVVSSRPARAASSAPSAGPRAAGVEDLPPPLPPKRRSRAVVSSRPARAAPSAAAKVSATARFDKMMDWLGREGRRGVAYRLPADQQHRAVTPLVGQLFHAMDTEQVSELYDALLALIDRWPPLLQPAVLQDLSEQAFGHLPEQRLAEHCQRWLNRLSGLAPLAKDDLLEHIATHFAAVPADDGLAVFQRLVELSRNAPRPILSLLARRLEGLPTALRNLAQQILLGCPYLAADVRQELNAAQQAAAAAGSGAASVDSGIGSIAT